ncbi:uncharacterized protein LOC123532071 [Mercenaria mercenaria]|uniref:uncharacterized protein LOC123532071 n=1 Tax=Mercenaria mercenaria TaxID=6596 RepID=UPI00234F35B1|nr:uncharacterized protein LOC123532071 [Mercenaria mercenaria]
MGNLYFLGIFFCLLNRGEAIRCFECRNIPFPRECTKVVECSSDEYCSVEQVVVASGNVVFNSGCLHNSRCSSTGISLIGKRSAYISNRKRSADVTICSECCKDDFCNKNGCGTTEVPFGQRGPYCFNCDAAIDAKSCSDVTVCGKNELCMLYSPVLQTTYKSQCETQLLCDALSKVPSSHKCAPICCQTDFCNNQCGTPSNITMPTVNPQTTSQVLQTSEIRTTSTTQTKHPTVGLSTQSSFTTQGATDRPTSNVHFHCDTNGPYIHLQNSNAHLCVNIVFKHATWLGARHACNQEGGDLVVLDTHEKSLLMRNKLSEYDHNGFWIGLKDEQGHGQFTWVHHHQPVGGSNVDWAFDQPDHVQYGVDQDCVIMLSSSHYQWHDTNCQLDHFYFICERR